MILQTVRGNVHSAFSAVPGSWRHERFFWLDSTNLVKFLEIHWQFDESLLCWKYATSNYSSFFLFLALEQSEIAGQSHTAVVLLTKYYTSTVIISALETQRVCRTVCSPVQSFEAALISLGDSLSTETERLSKAPRKLGLSKPITYHGRILPHSKKYKYIFPKMVQTDERILGSSPVELSDCLAAASCRYVDAHAKLFIRHGILDNRK